MAKRQPHCIVIGAGLAGLAAALKLSDDGWRITILESADRIGGRVLTKKFDESNSEALRCELGAEWIGEDHHRVLGLCRKFHLSLKRHQFASKFWPRRGGTPKRILPGRWPFSKEAKHGFEKLKHQFKAIKRLKDEKEKRKQLQSMDQADWWTTLGRNGFSAKELARAGQWFWVRRRLLEPHRERVYFAGEHLSEEWQGFMEGAVETGYAAAKAVVTHRKASLH